MKFRTTDREATPVLINEQIGPKRAKTPEGYLLCMDVPVARTGMMIYGPGEIPVEPGPEGIIRIERDAEALFSKKTLASYSGKAIVDDHPDDDVGPKNWKTLSIGVVLNPRRGEGDDSDVMLADLLVTDAQAIRDVQSGKREVSAGYEADYEQVQPGLGRQSNIIGNHVALVEKGRCGPRCSIGDHQTKGPSSMSKPRVIVHRRRVGDEELPEGGVESGNGSTAGDLSDETDGEGGDTHVHIHMGGEGVETASGTDEEGEMDPNEARFAALEAGHQEIKAMIAKLMAKIGGETTDEIEDPASAEFDGPAKSDTLAGADDDLQDEEGAPEEIDLANKAKTGDSAALSSAFAQVMADAEVLLPGVRLPTFDSKMKRRATMDTMCSLRRKVVERLASTRDGAEMLANVGVASDISKASCASIATTFRAAAGAKRMLNNAANTRDANGLPNGAKSAPANKTSGSLSIREINERNRKFHGQSA